MLVMLDVRVSVATAARGHNDSGRWRFGHPGVADVLVGRSPVTATGRFLLFRGGGQRRRGGCCAAVTCSHDDLLFRPLQQVSIALAEADVLRDSLLLLLFFLISSLLLLLLPLRFLLPLFSVSHLLLPFLSSPSIFPPPTSLIFSSHASSSVPILLFPHSFAFLLILLPLSLLSSPSLPPPPLNDTQVED